MSRFVLYFFGKRKLEQQRSLIIIFLGMQAISRKNCAFEKKYCSVCRATNKAFFFTFKHFIPLKSILGSRRSVRFSAQQQFKDIVFCGLQIGWVGDLCTLLPTGKNDKICPWPKMLLYRKADDSK